MTLRINWNVRSAGTETVDSNCTLNASIRFDEAEMCLTRTDVSKYDNNWQISLHNRLERPDRQFRWLKLFRARWHRDTIDLNETETSIHRTSETLRFSIVTIDSWVKLIDEETGDFQITIKLSFPGFRLFRTRWGSQNGKLSDAFATNLNREENERRLLARSIVLHHSVPKFSWRWFAVTAVEIYSKRTVTIEEIESGGSYDEKWWEFLRIIQHAFVKTTGWEQRRLNQRTSSFRTCFSAMFHLGKMIGRHTDDFRDIIFREQ